MKRRYRIITDRFLGFEVQYTYWWFPFWIELDWTNTHNTISEAKEYIEQDKQTNIINKIRAEFKKIRAEFKKYKREVVWEEK
ncbi:MAG: hypothetical protein RBR45_14215 [Pseudomonas sp.]|nr:hypothetical protein [Pseudomonas sp.]